MELTINKTFPSQYKKEIYYLIGEDAEGNEYKIKGKFNIDLDVGDMIHVSKYTRVDDYLECAAYEKVRNKNVANIYNFLVSEIKGVGEVFADRITRKFGEETMDVIDQQPNQLMDVEGVGSERMFKILESVNAVPKEKKQFMLIGLSAIMAERAMHRFVYDEVVENPYLLLIVAGMGWHKVDNIAVKGLSYDKLGEYRLFAAVSEVMRVNTEVHGNTYMEVQELIKKTCELLMLNIEEYENIISGVVQRMKVA